MSKYKRLYDNLHNIAYLHSALIHGDFSENAEETLQEMVLKAEKYDQIAGPGYQCFHCLSYSVGWDSDFDSEDVGYAPGGLVHICHCSNCGAEIQYLLLPEEDEDGNFIQG